MASCLEPDHLTSCFPSSCLLPSLCSGLELCPGEEGGAAKLARVSCLIPCRLEARTASVSKQARTHTVLNQIVASQYLLLWPQQEQEAPGKPHLLASSSMNTPWSWGLSMQEQSQTPEVAAMLATTPVPASLAPTPSQPPVPSLPVFVDYTKQPSE